MAARRRVLILAGSTEASALARRLGDDDRYEVTLSYAGRTQSHAPLPGRVRVGGFGGVNGLVRYLQSERVDALLDATHPFAAQMPHHAARGRARRPGWPGYGCAEPRGRRGTGTTGATSTTWMARRRRSRRSAPAGCC